jgi:hypothetical protein
MWSVQTIIAKYGVPCNNKPLLWFFAEKRHQQVVWSAIFSVGLDGGQNSPLDDRNKKGQTQPDENYLKEQNGV